MTVVDKKQMHTFPRMRSLTVQQRLVQPVGLTHLTLKPVTVHCIMKHSFGDRHSHLTFRMIRFFSDINQFNDRRIYCFPLIEKHLEIIFSTQMRRLWKARRFHRLRPFVFCNNWSMAVKMEVCSSVEA